MKMATVPEAGPNGVFVSLPDIWREQRDQGRCLSQLQGDVAGLSEDMVGIKEDLKSIKSRQLPAWAATILGGVAVAVTALVLEMIMK